MTLGGASAGSDITKQTRSRVTDALWLWAIAVFIGGIGAVALFQGIYGVSAPLRPATVVHAVDVSGGLSSNPGAIVTVRDDADGTVRTISDRPKSGNVRASDYPDGSTVYVWHNLLSTELYHSPDAARGPSIFLIVLSALPFGLLALFLFRRDGPLRRRRGAASVQP